MSLEAYSEGTIKVVWIVEGKNEIYSKMFKTEEEAEAFAREKKDYLIFSLLEQEHMKEFTWKLLPYGNYDLYQKLISLYHKHKNNDALLGVFRKLL